MPRTPEPAAATSAAPAGPPERRPGGLRTAAAAAALSWREARLATVVVVVLTAATGAFPAVSAWFVKLLFDELARGGGADLRRVLLLALASALAGAMTTVAASASGYASRVAQAELSVAVEDRLVAAVGALRGLRWFESPRYLDRLRLAQQGAVQGPPAVTGLAQDLIRVGVTVAGFAGAVVVVWPPMVLLLVGALVPAVLSQVLLTRLRARSLEATAPVRRRHEEYRSLVTDVRAAKETRLYGLAALFHSRTVAALRDATRTELRVERTVLVARIGVALVAAAVSTVAVAVAALRAARGELGLGDVTLFTAAVAALQVATIGVVGQVSRTGTALILFGHYLGLVSDARDLVDGTVRPGPLRDAIELRDVWFRYDEDGPWVLRGVDLTLPAGRALGLVGLNGAGKSTLVKLLGRFYDPQHGQIRWDGTDLRDLDLAALRARVGATFQDYMTYDLTAAENIGLGDVTRLDDRERIREAAGLAGADTALERLPRGYDTLLSRAFADGDDDEVAGAYLSGGQWQRVALARSLVRRGADLLILDEPSSGLDAEAEHRVHETLRAHRDGRTSLLVSHRLAALRDADRIAVLREGVVAEQGTHDELLAAGGEYARLFRLQARGYAAAAEAAEVEAAEAEAAEAGAAEAGAAEADEAAVPDEAPVVGAPLPEGVVA